VCFPRFHFGALEGLVVDECGDGGMCADRKGGGVEARLAVWFGGPAERGVEAWDIDCGRLYVAELGAEGVVLLLGMTSRNPMWLNHRNTELQGPLEFHTRSTANATGSLGTGGSGGWGSAYKVGI